MSVKQKRRGSNTGANSLGSSNVLMDACHDYVEQLITVNDEDFPQLPVTPRESPAPKRERRKEITMDGDNIITTLSQLINDRADGIEKKLGARLDELEKKIESSCAEVVMLKENVSCMEQKLQKCTTSVDQIENRVYELEAYSRRWNLKLYGVRETEAEDVRREVIKICQALLPEEKSRLVDGIEAVHRLGPKRKEQKDSRVIIMKFISRALRDAVWKAAKKSSFLQVNKLRFTEDLCKTDREKRQLLWPVIDSARKAGKKAYFVGGRAFIEGREVFPPSVAMSD